MPDAPVDWDLRRTVSRLAKLVMGEMTSRLQQGHATNLRS
jgi:hypothetical protein